MRLIEHEHITTMCFGSENVFCQNYSFSVELTFNANLFNSCMQPPQSAVYFQNSECAKADNGNVCASAWAQLSQPGYKHIQFYSSYLRYVWILTCIMVDFFS